MALMFDGRVPVAFGPGMDAQEDDVVVADGLGGGTGHDAGCACCTARSPAAQALGRLFTQRARGEVAFFRRVLIDGDAAAEASVRAALQSDPVVAARFRLA